jgi:putative sigma-54 modulation protein
MNNNDLIISGNHLELTARMKSMVESKTAKLFTHEEGIQRLRVELGCEDLSPTQRQHWVKGHIEIDGKPLIVKEYNEQLYGALDLVVLKLDRMLRRRSRLQVVKRKQKKSIDIPAHLPKIPDAA